MSNEFRQPNTEQERAMAIRTLKLDAAKKSIEKMRTELEALNPAIHGHSTKERMDGELKVAQENYLLLEAVKKHHFWLREANMLSGEELLQPMFAHIYNSTI